MRQMVRKTIIRQVYGVGKNWILRLKSRVSQDEQNSASGLRLAINTNKTAFYLLKGIDTMTREQALRASSALDDIDGFEALMSMIERDINEAADMCDISEFSQVLLDLMDAELERRKKVLESL